MGKAALARVALLICIFSTLTSFTQSIKISETNKDIQVNLPAGGTVSVKYIELSFATNAKGIFRLMYLPMPEV